MTDRLEPPPDRTTISGRATEAWVITAIVVCTLSFWAVGTRQPWPGALLLILGITLGGLAYGGFRQTTTLQLSATHLTRTSWMRVTQIPREPLGSMSLRLEVFGRSVVYWVVFWDLHGRELGCIPISPFRGEELLLILTTLQRQQPHVAVDLELQRVLRESY
jgi:hypothetical protein